MELPADPGLTLLVYTAELGSPTQDALNLLASWATTPASRKYPHESRNVTGGEAGVGIDQDASDLVLFTPCNQYRESRVASSVFGN